MLCARLLPMTGCQCYNPREAPLEDTKVDEAFWYIFLLGGASCCQEPMLPCLPICDTIDQLRFPYFIYLLRYVSFTLMNSDSDAGRCSRSRTC